MVNRYLYFLHLLFLCSSWLLVSPPFFCVQSLSFNSHSVGYVNDKLSLLLSANIFIFLLLLNECLQLRIEDYVDSYSFSFGSIFKVFHNLLWKLVFWGLAFNIISLHFVSNVSFLSSYFFVFSLSFLFINFITTCIV